MILRSVIISSKGKEVTVEISEGVLAKGKIVTVKGDKVLVSFANSLTKYFSINQIK